MEQTANKIQEDIIRFIYEENTNKQTKRTKRNYQAK